MNKTYTLIVLKETLGSSLLSSFTTQSLHIAYHNISRSSLLSYICSFKKMNRHNAPSFYNGKYNLLVFEGVAMIDVDKAMNDDGRALMEESDAMIHQEDLERHKAKEEKRKAGLARNEAEKQAAKEKHRRIRFEKFLELKKEFEPEKV